MKTPTREQETLPPLGTADRGSRHVSVTEVARHFGVHRTTVIRWLKLGHLAGIRLPGGYRIPIDVLDVFKATRAVTGRQPGS